ncbi:hypothetical protein LK537_27285 [Lachnoclostridium pacaense]|uniref:TcpD family membrane protein n=1 Tax=Enterocloster hominis (ex Hitch et al. 2024) TaxID=1917870 RepID=UPI001D130754|nr:TcpD family membrane protein [Lachnoclostridium pacaense]MCC2821003.1 hypothetical protein [Lachnoclostridium pacaense]
MKISENARLRKVITIWLTVQLVLSMAMVSWASNYAENAAKWGLDQAVWVVLFITLAVSIGAAMKHATGTMFTTIIIGGLLAFFCKQPEKVIEIGNAIGNKIFGG